jgi:hypothetical protein
MKQNISKTCINVIYIPFTGVGIPGYGGDMWLHERILLFLDYTLQSLKHQTIKDFYLWLSFRPEEKGSVYIEALDHALKTSGVKFVMTFDGLMYHDDKFGGSFTHRLKNVARVIRRAWKAHDWSILKVAHQVFFNTKNKTLKQRLSRSLKKIRKILPSTKKVYLSRIDSDDMFSQDYLSQVRNLGKKIGTALVVKNGYIYNQSTKELAIWKPQTNPPFHTIIFRNFDFFRRNAHYDIIKDYKSHEDVTKIFTHRFLKDGSYCVLTHSPKLHISTTWNHPFRGDIITNKLEKSKILKKFNIK